MKRRDFILAGIACTLAARPLVAQQGARMPHVGILNYAADDDIRVRQFRAAIGGSGYVEGSNLTLTLRSADGVFDRLPSVFQEQAHRRALQPARARDQG
jgi:hypothetical protein